METPFPHLLILEKILESYWWNLQKDECWGVGGVGCDLRKTMSVYDATNYFTELWEFDEKITTYCKYWVNFYFWK